MNSGRASILDPLHLAFLAVIAIPPADDIHARRIAGNVTATRNVLHAAHRQAAAGRAAFARGDHAAAGAAFDLAIAAIGTSYVHPGTMDDTGMQLVLARSRPAHGDQAGAARLKAAVVEARLRLLAAGQH